MGKFEEDNLNRYHCPPLIWLRFLDGIFLIWEYSEEELLDIITYIDSAHHSIKIFISVCTEKTTFLDVDISTNSDDTLNTLVQ